MNKRKIDTIYLDIDDVLLDVTNSINVLNINWDKFNNLQAKDQKTAINGAIYNNTDFFLKATPFKHAKTLYLYCYKLSHNVCFLSLYRRSKKKPENQEIARANKVKWIHKHISLSISPERVIIADSSKAPYARARTLLVDDNKKNTTQWKNKGGISIHFTTWPNCLYRLRLLSGTHRLSTSVSLADIRKRLSVRKQSVIKR